MKKWEQNHFHIAHIILPILTLLCFAGFIGSLLFPKKVLDTYSINVSEEEGDEEFLIPLNDGTSVYYELNTAGRPMKGIQPGISRQGASLEGVSLCYQVYEHSADRQSRLGKLLSDNKYQVSEGDDIQYVYLPFADSEACVGDIIIRFYCEGLSGEAVPALLANHTLIDHTTTVIGSRILDGSLKVMYVYTHDTYPLLYDFRLMTCVFLAASMTVSYPKRKGGKTA